MYFIRHLDSLQGAREVTAAVGAFYTKNRENFAMIKHRMPLSGQPRLYLPAREWRHILRVYKFFDCAYKSHISVLMTSFRASTEVFNSKV